MGSKTSAAVLRGPILKLLVLAYIYYALAPTASAFPVSDCRKIYLDVGTNIGVQIRKFFEPEKYPDALILPYFDANFGNATVRRSDPSICVFGFEANPVHTKRLKIIENCYRKQNGWNVHIFAQRVVMDKGRYLDIYSDSNSSYEDWGAGIVRDFRDQNSTVSYRVRVLNLGAFISRKFTHQINSDTHIFMKMDIEGAEYHVLPDLVRRKLLCKGHIDEAVIELHGDSPTRSQADEVWKTVTGDEQLVDVLRRLSECGTHSNPTQIVYLDDETYLRDYSTAERRNMTCPSRQMSV